MPTSNLAVAPLVLWLCHEVEHRTVLDVGPGHGKYALLLREYLNDPPEQIDAVEIHEPYVNAFSLRLLYDSVFVSDVLELPPERLAGYELVLMADVIEHLEKDAAIQLLARIPGRVVISTPVAYFSNGPGLPESETHRSHWTPEDFLGTERVEQMVEQEESWIVRLGPLPPRAG